MYVGPKKVETRVSLGTLLYRISAKMWLMLDKPDDTRYSAFAHNHSRDPGYQQ